MSEYRDYLTPKTGILGKDGRLYRAYLTPDAYAEEPDLMVTIVTFRDDSRYASAAGPLADDLTATIRDAASRFRWAAGYRYDGLSWAMIEKADAMLVRWLSIFHDSLALPVEMGSNRDAAIALLPREDFVEFQGTGYQDTFEALAKGDVDTYNMWADGDVWGYVVEVALDEDGGTYGDVYPDLWGWDEEDAVWGYYGTESATESARESLGYYVEVSA